MIFNIISPYTFAIILIILAVMVGLTGVIAAIANGRVLVRVAKIWAGAVDEIREAHAESDKKLELLIEAVERIEQRELIDH